MKKSIFIIITINCMVIFFCSLLQAQTDVSEDTSTLKAKGHGIVIFEGEGSISIGGDGLLVVNENSIVNFITIDGEVIPPEEAECIPTEEGDCVYIVGLNDRGVDAKAQIEGEELRVDFTGANIGLKIAGKGTLVLKGYGIYIYQMNGKEFGRWLPEGTTVTIEP